MNGVSQMAAVQTRVGPVSYSDSGSGPVVVALHATLHDRRDFDPVAEELRRRYRFITLDWPGHGESPSLEEPFVHSAALYADVLTDVVEALNLPPAVYVGNSVGGFCAARLSLTHPDRVAGLVLVDTGGFLGGPITNAYCRFLGTPAVTRALLPRFIRSYMRARGTDDRAVLDRVTARARTDEGVALAAALWRSFAVGDATLRSEVRRIAVPTLIVWGSKDTAIPLRFGRRTQSAIPGSRLEVLDTGHLPFASRPQEFLGVVEPFLADVLAADARSSPG
jgi:pimeloyl-ACP methyl ester carboxylesterase